MNYSRTPTVKQCPINDPQPGDRIQQGKGGLIIEVTKRDGDRVWWKHKTPKAKAFEPLENSWSIAGWRDTVCDGAVVLDD